MASRTARVQLELDVDLQKRLSALGSRRRRSPGWLMKEAIRDYLAREEAEDRRDEETLEALDDYDRTGLHVTHEELSDWLKKRAAGKSVKPPKPHL